MTRAQRLLPRRTWTGAPSLSARLAAAGAALLLLGPALPAAAQDQGGGGEASGEQQESQQQALESLSAKISSDVEVLRGHEFRHPVPVEVSSKEDLLAYLKKEEERTTKPGEIAAQDAAAKLLGVIPADMDLEQTMVDLLESQVGGFYDPPTKKFYVMESFAGTDLLKIILSHELTHALDDQVFDIGKAMDRMQDETDRALAYHCVVEGSATVVMSGWMMKHMAELDLASLMKGGGPGDFGLDTLQKTPAFVWRPLVACYTQGAEFLTPHKSGLDPEHIDAAFAHPPLSTEQVLHPDKYWDAGQRDDPRAVTIGTDSLPEGWSSLDDETLGELQLAICAEGPKERAAPKGVLGMATLHYTNAAAEGWGGDHYALVGRGDARLLHLVTAWDTPADAQEFRAALEGLADGVRTEVADVAKAKGLAGSGYRLEPAGAPDEVRVTSWLGLSDQEASALVAKLVVSVAPPTKPSPDEVPKVGAGSSEAGTDAGGDGR